MKAFIPGRTLLILVCLGLCCLNSSAQTASDDPLTNSAVVKLVKANFKEKTIISIIGARATRFDLDFDESWNDEAFFNQGNDALKIDKQSDPGANSSNSGNSTDIFGSSGGFKGGTRSKGGNSSSGGDTITTGSATVRILRPPTEAGAVPKLEKVATLTNNSIVELIEAGFSEGTIIRRIEQSPVEFDLSPEKLAELRKHRVSEKILSAMKTATGDTSDVKNQPTSNGTPRR